MAAEYPNMCAYNPGGLAHTSAEHLGERAVTDSGHLAVIAVVAERGCEPERAIHREQPGKTGIKLASLT